MAKYFKCKHYFYIQPILSHFSTLFPTIDILSQIPKLQILDHFHKKITALNTNSGLKFSLRCTVSKKLIYFFSNPVKNFIEGLDLKGLKIGKIGCIKPKIIFNLVT